jgi:catechol 2,3-dioxygenase-like lactoylglutathione lyase family enzyme
MDMRLELVLVPVSDVDRAKAFYVERAGFRLDVDTRPAEGMRVVQLTPPGSSCSITIGEGLELAEPGTIRGTHLVVANILAARDELAARGVEVSEVRHFDREAGSWRPGPDPAHADYASFANFADPDGNTWVLQEVGHSAGG